MTLFIFQDENGKNATDAIYTSLAPDDRRATSSSLELMLLQADLTIVSAMPSVSALRELSSTTSASSTRSLD